MYSLLFPAGEGCSADAIGCWERVPAEEGTPGNMEMSLAMTGCASSHHRKGLMGHLQMPVPR